MVRQRVGGGVVVTVAGSEGGRVGGGGSLSSLAWPRSSGIRTVKPRELCTSGRPAEGTRGHRSKGIYQHIASTTLLTFSPFFFQERPGRQRLRQQKTKKKRTQKHVSTLRGGAVMLGNIQDY